MTKTTRNGIELRFARVHLRNWRNFTEADVALQRRVFLVGPNASGKSNFLDVFRFLHDLVSIGGGFQDALARRGGVSKVRALTARRTPDVEVAVHLGTPDESSVWHYELRFSQDKRGRPVVTSEHVVHQGKTLLERPDREDTADPERLTQTSLEQVNEWLVC